MLIKCEYCGKEFNRENKRITESVKMNWKQFCSLNCLALSRTTRIATFCTNPLCTKNIVRSYGQAIKSKHIFCSKSCSTRYYNAIRIGHCRLRTCKRPGCNKYISSANPHKLFCTKLCGDLHRTGQTSYTPISVIEKINRFVKTEGRIPTRNELGQLNRLARRFFGSWNKAIIAAGYDPNPVIFAKKHIARDGHHCDSLAEKIVDDWLSARKIEHDIHVPYPWNNGMKCDFWVNDTWIEVFGLSGQNAKYDALKKNKLRLIKLHKLKLIKLSLNDVYRVGIERKLLKLNERRRHPS